MSPKRLAKSRKSNFDKVDPQKVEKKATCKKFPPQTQTHTQACGGGGGGCGGGGCGGGGSGGGRGGGDGGGGHRHRHHHHRTPVCASEFIEVCLIITITLPAPAHPYDAEQNHYFLDSLLKDRKSTILQKVHPPELVYPDSDFS